MLQSYGFVFVSVLFNVMAQLLLKKGISLFDNLKLSFDKFIELFISVFTNIYLFSGMFCFAISAFLWLFVLNKFSVSVAYPLGSLGYILTAILAYFFLNEPLTFTKIIGITLICLGVAILSYSKSV